jgi:hypothetical protein
MLRSFTVRAIATEISPFLVHVVSTETALAQRKLPG